VAANRDEDKLLGTIDAQKRAQERYDERIKNRDRDESTEEILADGGIRGRHVEYKTVTFEDGVTKRIKTVVRYWQSAEAVKHSKFKG